MKELSLLELKCLANMPTLLDTIVFTLNNLRDILLSIYDAYSAPCPFTFRGIFKPL